LGSCRSAYSGPGRSNPVVPRVRPDDPETGGAAASALLLAEGLLALPVVLAPYRSLASVDRESRAGAAVFGVAGALGAAVHGGYDLAVAIEPPATTVDGPSQADPRGLLTFAACATVAP